MKTAIYRYAQALLAILILASPLPTFAAATATLPLTQGFADGQAVFYIQTEASDAGVALQDQVHFVPKLAGALTAPLSAVDDIYVVTNFTQPNILASVPGPVGPMNSNGDYSPLWEVNMVTWVVPANATTLKSEAEVLAAQTAGSVTITQPGVVVNCPVLFASAHGASFDKTVTLPLVEGLYDGAPVFYITTEASNAGVAAGDNATFVSKLANAINATTRAVDDIYVVTNFTQPNILPAVPEPFGPSNADPDYSPLWEVNMITWNTGFTPRQLNDETEVLAAQTAGEISIAQPGIVVNCPVIHIPGVGTLAKASVAGVTGTPAPNNDSGGCVMNPNARFDPVLLLMLALSVGYLLRRRFTANVLSFHFRRK